MKLSKHDSGKKSLLKKSLRYLELMYTAFSALSLLGGGSTCNNFDQLASDDGLTSAIV